MILYYTVSYHCVTNHSRTQWLKKRRFIISHEMACQLDGFAYLLWVRLISAGFALTLQSVSRLDGCWLVYLGLTWVIQRLYFVCSPFLQWAWSGQFSCRGRSPGPQEKALFQGLVAEWLHYVLYHVLKAKKLQDRSECEQENKLNFLIDRAIKSHCKNIGFSSLQSLSRIQLFAIP